MAEEVDKATELDIVDDISNALSDFVPQDPESKKRLQTALSELVSEIPMDLKKMDEAKLMATDTIAQGRRLYIGSLLRLWNFIGRLPLNFEQEEKQARVALGFVKHVEGSRTLAFSFGRTQSDKKLASEVNDLRSQLQDMVNDRRAIRDQANEGAIDVQARPVKTAKPEEAQVSDS
jgi:hypothetical protein